MKREVVAIYISEWDYPFSKLEELLADGWNLQGVLSGWAWCTRDIPDTPTVPYGKWLTRKEEKKDATNVSL